jgi:nitroreductase
MHTMQAMKNARAIILCIVDKDPEAVYEGYSFSVEDCAAAVENIMLAITALGYATVWIDGWLRLEKRAEKIAQIIDLPGSKKIKTLLPIGIPKEKLHQREKKAFTQRACFNRYSL